MPGYDNGFVFIQETQFNLVLQLLLGLRQAL